MHNLKPYMSQAVLQNADKASVRRFKKERYPELPQVYYSNASKLHTTFHNVKTNRIQQ